MRFRPNRRAFTDHAPGPSIAKRYAQGTEQNVPPRIDRGRKGELELRNGTLLQRALRSLWWLGFRQTTLGDRSRQSSQKSVMIFHTQGVRWILCEPHRAIEEDDATN